MNDGIRPPVPRGDHAPRRFVMSDVGNAPVGDCSPQAKMAAIPFQGMPPVGDIEWGRYSRPIVKTGSAEMTVLDAAGPPPIYQPAWEASPATIDPNLAGLVLTIDIPLGFTGFRIRWKCDVIDSAWNDAVLFRLYVGMQDLVDPWIGASQGEQEITNIREAREGQTIKITGRIAAAYSTGGATPVTDLVIATAVANVWLLKNTDRKTGC